MPEGHFSSAITWLVDVGYWILPKPADFSVLLFNALDAKNYFGPLFDLKTLEAHGFSIGLSIATSLAFTRLHAFCLRPALRDDRLLNRGSVIARVVRSCHCSPFASTAGIARSARASPGPACRRR